MNDKNDYEIIKKSLENEMSIDSYLIKLLNLKAKRISYFKVARFKDRIPTIVSLIISMATPLFFLIQIIVSLNSKSTVEESKSDCLFLSFTESPKIIGLYNDYGHEQPFRQCVSGRILFFIKEMTIYEIVKSFFKSLQYSAHFLLSVPIKYSLHVTSIFELVAFNNYLENLISNNTKEITLTNHYDRWITLICEKGNFKVNIIQHGVFYEDFTPTHKINNVKSFRGINEKQLNIFSSNISYDSTFAKLLLKPNLDIAEDDRCDVLIISNPFYLADELEIYQSLKTQCVDVKFRPHPLYINSEVLKIVDADDLCQGKRFPNPNCCLCKSSTLGYEYQALGYKLVTWGDEINIDSILASLK